MTEKITDQDPAEAHESPQEKKEKATRRRFDHKANLTIAGLVSLFAIIIFGLSAFGTGEARDAQEAQIMDTDQPVIDLRLNDPQNYGIDYDPEAMVRQALEDPETLRLQEQLREIVYE
jgi:hypothetical protein